MSNLKKLNDLHEVLVQEGITHGFNGKVIVIGYLNPNRKRIREIVCEEKSHLYYNEKKGRYGRRTVLSKSSVNEQWEGLKVVGELNSKKDIVHITAEELVGEVFKPEFKRIHVD